MPMITKYRNPSSDEISKKRQRPILITWKGVKMIRRHSFNAAVNEIITFSNEQDLTKIGLIGDPHSGKSTLAIALAHAIHQKSEQPFAVRIFTEKDLLNFEKTLKKLTPANYILIFDDVSFLGATTSKKDLEIVKQAVTKIRHLPGGSDVKIITILNYHYSLGLDKYLRQTDFKFFTTIGSSENDNVESMIGSKHSKLIREFQKKRYIGITQKKIPFRIGPKDFFAYKYRSPFIITIFNTPNSSRIIISPTRFWLDKICSKCTEASGMLTSSGVPIKQFMEESEKKFGVGAWRASVKLALFAEGMTTYNNNVVRGLKYLNRCRSEKQINLEECAKHYALTLTKTRLDKKHNDDDGVMSK